MDPLVFVPSRRQDLGAQIWRALSRQCRKLEARLCLLVACSRCQTHLRTRSACIGNAVDPGRTLLRRPLRRGPSGCTVGRPICGGACCGGPCRARGCSGTKGTGPMSARPSTRRFALTGAGFGCVFRIMRAGRSCCYAHLSLHSAASRRHAERRVAIDASA